MIGFNKPYMTGVELENIKKAHENGVFSGDGPFTKLCHSWLEKESRSPRALLTHSCTAALEIAALLLEIKPGDEVILPSYTFVSTANAFVLRGATPVFVDIRPDTLNLDENLLEEAITSATRVIVPVHYAGVSCEMDQIICLASKYKISIVEDAAQAVMSKYKNIPLGSIGQFGAYSFHETKNIISGEGGALLVNDKKLILPSEIVREKGTNRGQFFRGEVDKYTWQSIGSSYLPGEIIAAFLWAQLERAQWITDQRMAMWNHYHLLLSELEVAGKITRPTIPDSCQHNAHMYYIILSSEYDRDNVLANLRSLGVGAVFHYVPLHSSPGGRKFGRAIGNMKVTDRVSNQIIRLPLWIGLSQDQQLYVVNSLRKILN